MHPSDSLNQIYKLYLNYTIQLNKIGSDTKSSWLEPPD